MSTHSRDYGKDNSFRREYDDDNHQRRQGGQHGHPDHRHGTSQRKENPRRDGERRRDRRDYPEDRRSYGREYDDRRRGEDRELGRDRGRDRESRRDRDRDRDHQTRSDRRHRESSRERATQSRRSASPRRRSRSPTRSRSPVDKAKPNFNQSGLLAAATNTVKAADGTSTILKYNEPPEARKPTLGWRLYVFKGTEQTGNFVSAYRRSGLKLCMTELLHIHRQSAYLIGRDRTVADIFIEHPSCSKQHAVIQRRLLYSAFFSLLLMGCRRFTDRQVQEKDEFGGAKAVIKFVLLIWACSCH